MRRLLPFLLLTIIVGTCHAQDSTYVKPKKEPFNVKDRLWYGGGIGLSLGTVTAIQLDPVVGLKLGKGRKLSVGTGPSYFYFQDKRYQPAFSYTGIGYRVLSRYLFFDRAFAHAEFYHLNVDRLIGLGSKRTWVPHLLVGGGYREPMGEYSSVYIQVLWEVLNDPNSVYRGLGPIISGGVGIGF